MRTIHNPPAAVSLTPQRPSSDAGAAQGAVEPASRAPAVGVEAVAAVDDHGGGHDPLQLGGVEVAVDLPLGQVQHHVGTRAGLLHRLGIV